MVPRRLVVAGRRRRAPLRRLVPARRQVAFCASHRSTGERIATASSASLARRSSADRAVAVGELLDRAMQRRAGEVRQLRGVEIDRDLPGLGEHRRAPRRPGAARRAARGTAGCAAPGARPARRPRAPAACSRPGTGSPARARRRSPRGPPRRRPAASPAPSPAPRRDRAAGASPARTSRRRSRDRSRAAPRADRRRRTPRTARRPARPTPRRRGHAHAAQHLVIAGDAAPRTPARDSHR
jgi:hypothetical protein